MRNTPWPAGLSRYFRDLEELLPGLSAQLLVDTMMQRGPDHWGRPSTKKSWKETWKKPMIKIKENENRLRPTKDVLADYLVGSHSSWRPRKVQFQNPLMHPGQVLKLTFVDNGTGQILFTASREQDYELLSRQRHRLALLQVNVQIV